MVDLFRCQDKAVLEIAFSKMASKKVVRGYWAIDLLCPADFQMFIYGGGSESKTEYKNFLKLSI